MIQRSLAAPLAVTSLRRSVTMPRYVPVLTRCPALGLQDGDATPAHAHEHPDQVLAASPSRVPCLLSSKGRADSRTAPRLRGNLTVLATGPREGVLHPWRLEEG